MKKRILSLILALSMVLSVLPLGAFAEGFLPELVMQNGLPDLTGLTPQEYGNYVGNGWEYRNGTLYLNLSAGTYDFSYINPQTKAGGSAKQPVLCKIEIQSGATIIDGTFNGEVTNSGTIERGTFNGTVTNNTGGTISGGTFSTTVKNGGGTIAGGTFSSTVENNNGTIANGTFAGSVTNWITISGGTFEGSVAN